MHREDFSRRLLGLAARGESLALGRIPAAIIVALLLGLFARTFLVEIYEVESGSMSPALLPGDHILVDRVAYSNAGSIGPLESFLPSQSLRRGEVVVLKRPGGVFLVKRVVALPGETLEIHNGRVWIDGRALDEPWVTHSEESIGPVRLRSHEIYLLGDQRPRSRDSRHWGPARIEWLRGRAVLVFWSSARVEPSEDWGKIASNAWEKILSTRWDRWLRPVR